MASIKILKIFIISLAITSCAPNLDFYKNKVEDQHAPKERKSYLIDYSLRKEKIQKRFAEIFYSSDDTIEVAVMLPLSGKHKKLGQALFNSMQLALFDHSDPRIHLVPFDTKGNEFESIEQAKVIAAGHYASIIGPVFAKNVKAIKPIIQETNLTIISFSNDPQIAGENVFLIGMDIKEQVRKIAEYTTSQGYEYFATLLPGNDYGSTIITELRRVSYHTGATVLKSEFYSKQISLEQNVKNIARVIKEVPNDQNGEPIFRSYKDLAAIEIDEFGTPLYRDLAEFKVAILVPESGNMLKEILTLFKKYNIPQDRIKLIGLSNWYDNSELDDPYLQGAWFTDIPHENYDLFMEYYKSYFYIGAPRIAALAYDALSVVTSLASLNDDSPTFSNEMLTQEIGFNGISGVFRFLDTGISERLLAIYSIESNKIVTIEAEDPLFSFANDSETNTLDGDVITE